MPQLPALRQSKLPVTVPSPSSAKLAKQLVAAMAAIHRRGWCEGTGGNFSCVLQRQPLQLVMAPSGVDNGSVSPDELLVVDEAASIPLPIVKKMMGAHLTFLASTVNGYEGTGRSLSLKLLSGMRAASSGGGGGGGGSSSDLGPLKEVALEEKVAVSREVLEYIITEYAGEEKGVRELKRCIEAVTQKINMLRIFNTKDLPFHIKDFSLPFVVKKQHIELFLKKKDTGNESYRALYA